MDFKPWEIWTTEGGWAVMLVIATGVAVGNLAASFVKWMIREEKDSA